MNLQVLIGAVVVLTLVGCAAGTGGPTDAAPTDEEPPMSARDQPNPSFAAGEVPRDLLDAIVAEAAQRAAVDAAEVELVSAEAVTWSDGSIGCPEPGMMYTQALVPGYRVVVEAAGEELHFHAGESGDFRFCEDPQPPLDDGTVDR